MIEKSVKRDRLLAALTAALWLQEESGDLSIGRWTAGANKLYVDGHLNLNRLVDDVLAALEAPQEPLKAE